MGARFAMNRLKRSDQVLPGLNFTIGLSGERRASATECSMLHSNAVVKAPSEAQSRERGWCQFWGGCSALLTPNSGAELQSPV
jgi:hypothetical protein